MPNYRRLFIENSYLFITIVTNGRCSILANNIELLRESFNEAKKFYNFEIFSYVVLPEHMHIIIYPEIVNEYPKIVRAIKYNFSEKMDDGGIAIPPYLDEVCKAGLQSCHKKDIWQRRYFEHTIISEDDLNKHIDYIHYNPVKHGQVNHVKDWEYSSFNKFVQNKNYDINWGSDVDIKHIETMDYD